jgi:hypothetical protein
MTVPMMTDLILCRLRIFQLDTTAIQSYVRRALELAHTSLAIRPTVRSRIFLAID